MDYVCRGLRRRCIRYYEGDDQKNHDGGGHVSCLSSFFSGPKDFWC